MPVCEATTTRAAVSCRTTTAEAAKGSTEDEGAGGRPAALPAEATPMPMAAAPTSTEAAAGTGRGTVEGSTGYRLGGVTRTGTRHWVIQKDMSKHRITCIHHR